MCFGQVSSVSLILVSNWACLVWKLSQRGEAARVPPLWAGSDDGEDRLDPTNRLFPAHSYSMSLKSRCLIRVGDRKHQHMGNTMMHLGVHLAIPLEDVKAGRAPKNHDILRQLLNVCKARWRPHLFEREHNFGKGGRWIPNAPLTAARSLADSPAPPGRVDLGLTLT